MDSGAQLWAAIIALSTALSGVVTAAFIYLKAEVRELKTALVEANKSLAATNTVNAELASQVPGLLAQVQKLQRQSKSSSNAEPS